MSRLFPLIIIGVLTAACHNAKELSRAAALTFGITGGFGGESVTVFITEETHVSVIFRDERRAARDTSGRLAFADSIARFIVHWFGDARLTDVRFILTRSSESAASRTQATILDALFVPEYQQDGSVHLHHGYLTQVKRNKP